MIFTGTSAITLPNPEFGNSDSLNLRLSLVQMSSGALHTYKRLPSRKRLYRFNLTKAQLDAFEVWYLANSGGAISVDGFSGAITNNPMETTAVIGRGACEKSSVTIEFEETGRA